MKKIKKSHLIFIIVLSIFIGVATTLITQQNTVRYSKSDQLKLNDFYDSITIGSISLMVMPDFTYVSNKGFPLTSEKQYYVPGGHSYSNIEATGLVANSLVYASLSFIIASSVYLILKKNCSVHQKQLIALVIILIVCLACGIKLVL